MNFSGALHRVQLLHKWLSSTTKVFGKYERASVPTDWNVALDKISLLIKPGD